MLGWLYVYFFLGFMILRKLTVKWGFTLTMFAIVSFLVDIFLRKKQRDDSVEKLVLCDWKLVLFPLLAWTISTLIYIPIELYTANPGDFQFDFRLLCIRFDSWHVNDSFVFCCNKFSFTI